MKTFLHHLVFAFLIWGTPPWLYGQIDTLTGDKKSFQQEQLEAWFIKFREMPRVDRLGDSLHILAYEGMIANSIALQDTPSLAFGLRLKAEWASHFLKSKKIADSLSLYAQTLQATYGYVLSSEFLGYYNAYKYNPVYHSLKVVTDTTGLFSFDSIRSEVVQNRFHLNRIPPGGLDSSHVYWIRLRLRGDGQRSAMHLLLMNTQDQLWQEVKFYFPNRSGNWSSVLGGGKTPIEKRMTPDWRDFYRVEAEPASDYVVYFRLKGFKPKTRPYNFYLRHVPNTFLTQVKPRMLNRVYGFIAILTFQLFFFLLWFFATKDKTFIPYLVYIFGSVTIAFISLRLRYWFPNPDWNNDNLTTSLVVLFAWVAGMGIIQFTQKYLNTAQITPRWHKILQVLKWSYSLAGISLFLMMISWVLPTGLSERGMPGLTRILQTTFSSFFSIGLLLISITGVVSWRNGYEPAKYYLIATLCMLGSIGIMALVPTLGIFSKISFNEAMGIIQGGVVLQLCFFALGIGHKRRKLEQEKLEAQHQLLAEQSKVNTAFGRFVPHKFLEAIGRHSVLDVELGDGVEKEVSVFFSDIRGYTRLAEQMKPAENFRFLNGYLGRMGPIISKYQGFVNQYYGDGIMAIFMQKPEDALKAAISIQQNLQSYNQERITKNRMPIKIGIGLHTGPLIMGVIGDTLRMEAGVVSDTVNTAARMEGLTKHFGAGILLSETVFTGIADPSAYAYRYLGKVQVKGRQEPLDVYDFFDGDDQAVFKQKQQTQRAFEKGLRAYYQQDFARAAQAFDEVLLGFPDDKSGLLYLEKAKHYLVNGAPATWTGVEEMQSK